MKIKKMSILLSIVVSTSFFSTLSANSNNVKSIKNDKLFLVKEKNKEQEKIYKFKGFESYKEIKGKEKEEFISKIKKTKIYKMIEQSGIKIGKVYSFLESDHKLITTEGKELTLVVGKDLSIVGIENALVDKNGLIIWKHPVDVIKKYKDLITFSVGKESNPEIVVISDPDCPFCVKFEKNALDQLSKNFRVHIILTALKMHPDSIAKIEDIMKEPIEKRRKKLEEIQGIGNPNWKKHPAKNLTPYDIRYENLYRDVKFTGTPFIIDKYGRKLK